MEEAYYDRDYRDDLQRTLADELDNTGIFYGNDWILDQLVLPATLRTLRILYEREVREKGYSLAEVEKDYITPGTHEDSFKARERAHERKMSQASTGDVEMAQPMPAAYQPGQTRPAYNPYGNAGGVYQPHLQ
jgi:hypothetical protein